MIYRVIGLVSDSTMNGLQIGYIEFLESGGKWSYELIQSQFVSYQDEWQDRLSQSSTLTARDYILLNRQHSIWLGGIINDFIDLHQLHFKIALLSVHGYEGIRIDEEYIVSYLGDGAIIAATTQLPVITDLLTTTIALHGTENVTAMQAYTLLPALHDEPQQELIAVALSGILRWREEASSLAIHSGASRDVSGGAMWLG